MLMATVSIQALSVFLGSSTYPLYTWRPGQGVSYQALSDGALTPQATMEELRSTVPPGAGSEHG